MAIHRMVSKEVFEANPGNPDFYVIENYSGANGPIYMGVTHKGLVLELREWNMRDDSDFYARVWSPEKGCVERVDYATTRGWTYPNHADVDATPEVIEAVKAWEHKCAEEKAKRIAALAAKIPTVGKKVRVIKGRKLPKGAEGEVFWHGKDSYKNRYADKYANPWALALFTWEERYSADSHRVGIRLLDGSKHFVSAANVEVV
jgi:hypothetical protein